MKLQYSRVAIVHDVFVEFGGAERVLLELLALYPNADVFIPLLADDKLRLLRKYTTGNIQSSFLNKIPFIHSASILLKPLLFWYWQSLDLVGYDLVITSSHSFSSKAVITGALTKHVSYIHTPPRYLYVEYNETQILRLPAMRSILAPLLSWLRSQDYLAAQRPDLLIANSKTVQKRITKYYRRSSHLVYPPIHVPRDKELTKSKKMWTETLMTLSEKSKKTNIQKIFKSGRYFVCFSRLAKQKGIDLAVQTCAQLHLPLIVVGQGSEEKYLKSLAGEATAFVGAVPDAVKSTILSNAAALLYCSIEEDFGMVTVEALAHGVPVIGYNSGGTSEIVTRSTGVLFDEFSIKSLAAAIQKFNGTDFSISQCRKRAQFFSAEKFGKAMRSLVGS